jgi:hypothetical protein
VADRPDGGDKQLLAYVRVTGAEMALSQLKFREARSQAERALELAGTKYVSDATEAKRVLCLALVASGSRGEGLRLCQEALRAATELNNIDLISKATLALAQASAEGGDNEGALAGALRAQEEFARREQVVSEWRAWVVAARAGRQAGDQQKAQEYSERAAQVLAGIEQRWGAEAYSGYLSRPDVEQHRRQFDRAAANR